MTRTCAECARPVLTQKAPPQPGHFRLQGRGLCGACYFRAVRDGRLEDYPRTNRRDADTCEDHAELKAQGYTREQIAARLGMTREALDKAITRHNRKVTA